MGRGCRGDRKGHAAAHYAARRSRICADAVPPACSPAVRGPLRAEQEGGDPKVPAHGQPAKADISAAADCRLMPALVGCGAS